MVVAGDGWGAVGELEADGAFLGTGTCRPRHQMVLLPRRTRE